MDSPPAAVILPDYCPDNPYEQKLFSMFCGHDKEQRGWLTVNALQQLCTTLELKENGTKLTAALMARNNAGGVGDRKTENKPIRITFKAFKEELLHVLGTESQSSPSCEMGVISSAIHSSEENSPEKENEQQQLNGGSCPVNVVSDSNGGGGGGNWLLNLVKNTEEEDEEKEKDSFDLTSKSIAVIKGKFIETKLIYTCVCGEYKEGHALAG